MTGSRRFLKMHGLGNDFVVIDRRRDAFDLPPELIRRIGDRRRGVGFDQLVTIDADPEADARIGFFNGDGTRAGACGNATRCVIKLLAEESGRDRVVMRMDTGLRQGERLGPDVFRADMGAPSLDWRDVPLAEECDTVSVPLDFENLERPVALANGNPHAVFFVADVDGIDIPRIGPLLEHHPMFPERANIGFAQMRDRRTIRLRVFERSAGLTLACGSGACAALVAAVRRGLADNEATMQLDGGDLTVSWDGQGGVMMTGAATMVFEGMLADAWLAGE